MWNQISKQENEEVQNLPMLFQTIPIQIMQWNETDITSFLIIIKTVWMQLKDDSPVVPFSIPYSRHFKTWQ